MTSAPVPLDQFRLGAVVHPRQLFHLFFGLFKQTINKKCMSSIRCSYMHSNPRPSEYESPPLTTEPGLPL